MILTIRKRAKNRLLTKLAISKKCIIQSFRHSGTKRTLFIFGCQRSGTTHMTEIFMLDPDAEVFSEKSVLNIPPRNIGDTRPDVDFGLRGCGEVQRIMDRYPADLRIAKPIVDSQHAGRLLESSPSSKVVWIYRRYSDVVASNLKKFGLYNDINDLCPIVEGRRDDWRYERVGGGKTESLYGRFFPKI